ncbi:hypothetical protein VTK73DRAFT_8296 [Phialemonium thermophilum]|uniref:RRM domain-containing protein n=1 Tax=Phialemonium thermophilum TaxID=223376 RepID=A0ABR3W8X4_9PEZI
MSSRPPSRVVFVGNIPYGLSEEQISDIFSGAGKVLNFRLVYDRETGRPKGFGFAEYPDADSAASAVRNLNDYEIMGRKLRVDFSNEGVTDEDGRDRDGPSGQSTSYQQQSNGNSNASANYQSTALPPLPPGRELPPGVTCTDAISRTLNTLPPAQLLDILTQMRSLATTDPGRATELLNQAPQLSYAIFQALLLMGLVSPEAINVVLEAGGVVPPPPPPPPAQVAAPVQLPLNTAAYGAYPGVATGTPPVAAGYAPPPPVVPAAAPAPQVGAGAPAQDQTALIQALLELPQETIDMLPEGERMQVMALRAQYGAMRR